MANTPNGIIGVAIPATTPTGEEQNSADLSTYIDRHPIPDYTYYASLGFGVFPIKTGTKNTSFEKWHDLALYGEETAEIYWWSGHFPHFAAGYRNVGLSLDNRVVVDVDVNHGGGVDGFESLARLRADYGPLPLTRVHKSPRGGEQYTLLADPDRPMISRALHKKYPGIDIKAGRSARILCPGSVTEHGAYTVVSDHEIAPMPEWLYDVQEDSGKTRSTTGGRVRKDPEGTRSRAPGQVKKHNGTDEYDPGAVRELQKHLDAIRALENGDCDNGLSRHLYWPLRAVAGGVFPEQYVFDLALGAAADNPDIESGHIEGKWDYWKGRAENEPLDWKPSATPSKTDDRPTYYEVKWMDSATNITSLVDAVNDGAIPDLFVGGGGLVHVYTKRDDPSLPIGESRKDSRPVNQQVMGNLMSRHLECMQETKRENRDGTTYTALVRKQPTLAIISQVLAAGEWPGIPVLRRITRVPILRTDGTVLVGYGYDKASGVYYDPRPGISWPGQDPTEREVAEARRFLLDELLHDFPWSDGGKSDKANEVDNKAANKANAVAMLMTPALRDYINGTEGNSPTPLFVVKAHTASTGKTLLAELVGKCFGHSMKPWVDDEDELRKGITSLLSDQGKAVCILDNVGSGHRIGQAVLANLLTSSVWTDRVLGQTRNTSLVNDRLWIATGNNIRFAGDIAPRTVQIELDSGEERPDTRCGFEIADLNEWIKSPSNQARVVGAVLILARDWIRAGAKRETMQRRGYSAWFSAMAGLLDHHGITGFADNHDSVLEADTEQEQIECFLQAWHDKFSTNRKQVREVMASHIGGIMVDDEWGDSFLLVDAKTGHELSAQRAGNRLREMVGRPIGGLVMRSERPGAKGTQTKKSMQYWVEPSQSPQP